MTGYLDASVLIPLFCLDALNERAEEVIAHHNSQIVLSDLAVLEMSSSVARKVRVGDLSQAEAAVVFSSVDTFAKSLDALAQVSPADVTAAIDLVRRLDLGLRGPDALHIAIAQRLGATLFTFDTKMAAAAQAMGLAVVS